VTLGEQALVGTSRADTPPATGTPIDALVLALVGADSAGDLVQRVLLMAATADVYQRAGVIPARIDTVPPPAPLDPRRACAASVAAILSDMIDGDHVELLREAFERIADAGQRLPDPLLPQMLDLREPDVRRAAHAVLGERGRWLARHQDRWSWAAGQASAAGAAAPIEELRRTWEEGAAAHRLDAIAQVRASDPAMAREWIAAVWAREPVEDRIRLLAILETALGPDDEPWLESALKDRSLAVRARIAWLLARLPDSAFAARARARVDPLLAWERGALHVSPPTAVDPAWEQDGIVIKPPKGQGERGHWLSQLLAQVGPAHWSRRFQIAPRDLVRAAWRSEWGSALMTGWSRAAALHTAVQAAPEAHAKAIADADAAAAADANREWITATWDGWMAAPVDSDPRMAATRAEMLTMLFAGMPANAAEQRLIDTLRDPQATPPFDLASALQRLDGPWSDRLASAVLDALPRVPANLLPVAASQLPPSHLDRALAIMLEHQFGLPTNTAAAARRAIEQFVARIQLRQRLYQELAR
jgi:hypothetical protein